MLAFTYWNYLAHFSFYFSLVSSTMTNTVVIEEMFYTWIQREGITRGIQEIQEKILAEWWY